MTQPTVKIYPITSAGDLNNNVERMRFGARRHLIKEAPVYAKTHTELLNRIATDYLPNAGEILSDPRAGVLLFPPSVVESTPPVLISCVASIDVFDGEPASWHLSMCRLIRHPPPVRAPDGVVHRICKAFFTGQYTEGPPEGMLKDVRHFRAPWKPD